MNEQAKPTGSEATPIADGSIVVGHDGSRDSNRALEVALSLAERLGVGVALVRSWSIDTAPHGALYDHGYVSSFAEVSETVRRHLIAETSAEVAEHPKVVVDYRAALAQPAEILTGLSAKALMLVVGSRGLGGFAGLLLGSVSGQCVQHAKCPVLVVPSA